MAAYSGNFAILDELHKWGARLLEKNKHDDTPLHISIRHRKDFFSQNFVHLCADLVQKGQYEKGCLDILNKAENLTPFMLAVLREDFATADLLKETGLCNPEYKNSDGKSINKLCTEFKLPASCDYLGIPCPFVP